MYQQRRFAVLRVRRMQLPQFRTKFVQQRGRGPLFADAKAHAITAVYAFGKWTQVEADDGPLQPAACRRDDFVGSNAQSSATGRSLISPTSSMLITRFTNESQDDATTNSSHTDPRGRDRSRNR